MKKIILSTTILVILLFGFFIIKNGIGSMQENIYNDNEKIVSSANSYAYRNRTGGNKNRKTNISFYLTGMETLWAIKSDMILILK